MEEVFFATSHAESRSDNDRGKMKPFSGLKLEAKDLSLEDFLLFSIQDISTKNIRKKIYKYTVKYSHNKGKTCTGHGDGTHSKDDYIKIVMFTGKGPLHLFSLCTIKTYILDCSSLSHLMQFITFSMHLYKW